MHSTSSVTDIAPEFATQAKLPPFSHELEWPAGLEPYRLIDETGSQGEPFAHYAWMRKNAPVMRVKHGDAEVWMVSRQEDVRAALRKPKVFQSQVTEIQPLAFQIGRAHV